MRVRIRARDVILALERPRDISALNVLSCTVAEIGPPHGPSVAVQLLCGEDSLLVYLTRLSLERLGLAPGRAVYAIVKSVAIERGGVAGGAERARGRSRRRSALPTCRGMAWRSNWYCILVAAAAMTVSALPGSSAAGDMYRWRDRDGREHWGSVPAAGAIDVELLDSSARKGTLIVAPAEPAAGTRRSPAPESDSARRLRAIEEAEPSVIGGKSEGQWRAEALGHESNLESLREKLEKAEYELSNSYALGRSAYYQRRVDALKSQLEAAEQSFSGLEDRARELGVPPGWLR